MPSKLAAFAAREPTPEQLFLIEAANENQGPPPEWAAELDEFQAKRRAAMLILKPLGFKDSAYHYRSAVTGEVVALKPNDHGQKFQLRRLADDSYYAARYAFPQGENDEGPPKINWDLAGRSLMRGCHAAGVFDFNRVRGRGAWADGGSVVVHLGDHLLVDGRRVELAAHEGGRHIYPRDLSINLDTGAEPLPDEAADAVNILCSNFRWEHPLSGWLAAGWIVASMVCGALPFRPHTWITGGAGSGKTTLLVKIFKPLLGELALHVQSTSSEAGIRQVLGLDALPVLFDEAEGESERAAARIQAVLELARGASSESGARIVKGQANHTAKQFEPRSTFLFSSIGIGLKNQADKTRCVVLSLKSPPDKDLEPELFADEKAHFAAVEKAIAETITPEFAAGLFSRCVRLIPVIRKNAETLHVACKENLGTARLGDLIGTLLAGAHSLCSSQEMSMEDARKWVAELTAERDLAGVVEDAKERDEEKVLRHLMSAPARIELGGGNLGGGAVQRTVGQVVAAATDPAADPLLPADIAEAWLRRHGMKTDDAGWLLVATSHTELARIFAGSPWPQNWGNILRRLPGAAMVSSTAFSSRTDKSRAVHLPGPWGDDDMAD